MQRTQYDGLPRPSIPSGLTHATALEGHRTSISKHVVIIDERTELFEKLADQLRAAGRRFTASRISDAAEFFDVARVTDQIRNHPVSTVVFSPLRTRGGCECVDVDYAKSMIQACRQFGISHFVLISSAEIYGADYSNPGLMREREMVILKRPNRVATRWATIEALANESFGQGTSELVVLRPCWTLFRNGGDVASRLFRSRVAFLPAGFDPSIQLLSVDDLAAAITVAIESDTQGIFNIAPDGVIPLRKALRRTASWKLPIPYTFQRMGGAVLRWEINNEQLDFIRYSWTVSNEKSKDELGFRPSTSSSEALAEFAGGGTMPRPDRNVRSRGTDRRLVRESSESEVSRLPLPDKPSQLRYRRHIQPTPHEKPYVQPYDDFGMDAEYIRSCGRRQLDFMERVYWRIEVAGLEHLPLDGGGVLAGLHRGFMPFDGVMLVHLLSKKTGRIPRFLMHPALVKYPFLATFLTRLGGIIACQENADHVLQRGEIVGVFPEGIRGAFRMYDRGNTYRLGKFRDDYVKTALRYGVPIVPFVTVGPAEIFPILAKIEWPWWKRQTHWPCFPITATWPLLPVPLPTKWHIELLPPITTAEYSPEAANDRAVVRQISAQVRERMQTAIDDLRSRRKSIFFGSIFPRDARSNERPAGHAVTEIDAPHALDTPQEVA